MTARRYRCATCGVTFYSVTNRTYCDEHEPKVEPQVEEKVEAEETPSPKKKGSRGATRSDS